MGEELQARLLERIGLDAPPSPDADGLRTVHRAFVSSLPYENLAVQLGESGPLEPTALCERMLAGGRGGYCFEINTVLLTLLESLGFEVERRYGVVGPRGAHADGEPTNHMALVATTPAGERFVVEAGWGEGSLDPFPLREGEVRSGPFTWALERDGEGWWVQQHEHGSSPGFHFADEPASLADFAPHHRRLSIDPESSFVRILVVEQPREDRIVTLRSRTLSARGPGVEESRVLADRDDLAAVLDREFGIDPAALGPERLGRLWASAVAQHQVYLAENAPGAGG